MNTKSRAHSSTCNGSGRVGEKRRAICFHQFYFISQGKSACIAGQSGLDSPGKVSRASDDGKKENVCRFSSFLLLREVVDPQGVEVGVGCEGRKDARHKEVQFGTKLMRIWYVGHKLQAIPQER